MLLLVNLADAREAKRQVKCPGTQGLKICRQEPEVLSKLGTWVRKD